MSDRADAGMANKVDTVWVRKSGRVAAALIAVLMLPNVVWNWLDGHIWPWDQANYGAVSTGLFETLVRHPADWPGAMMNQITFTAPLLPWLGQFAVPFGVLTGHIDFSLMALNLTAQSLTLLFVWKIGRIFAPDQCGIAVSGVLFVGAAPLFIGVSEQFFTEDLQATIIAASFYLALVSQRISFARLLIFLVLIVTAGMAIKTTTVLYCGLAWAVCSFDAALRIWRKEKWYLGATEISLGGFALLFAAFTTNWYLHNAQAWMQHIRDATSNDIALEYGHVAPLWSKLAFWSTMQSLNFSLIPWLFFPIALLTLLVTIIFSSQASLSLLKTTMFSWEKEASDRAALVAGLCLVHVLAVTLVLALQINEETRFLFGILPGWAALLMFTLASLRNFPLSGVVAFALSAGLVLQYVTIQLQVFNYTGPFSHMGWLSPLATATTDKDLADKLVQNTCDAEHQGAYVVVGPEEPAMNGNSLTFHAAKNSLRVGYRCYYTGLGYAEKDSEKALTRIDDLKARYVILPRPDKLPQNPNFLNLALSGVEQRIRTGNSFSALPGEFGDLKIYKRSQE